MGKMKMPTRTERAWGVYDRNRKRIDDESIFRGRRKAEEDAEFRNFFLEEDRLVVLPVTITYTVPAKRKAKR